ncbi:hypothetical protein [Planctomicrobium piriforme]|uniref:Uncharacterized protein n=1 Tax=Planctomicrobium piriforme TaxID=1576369 RepID=A0A1I3QZ02_9PLAN|nr:hypothetical protein [Planctomicrobium piriforme]SFJ38377.1 hypothetical protein SAMN05421753_11975 [Planctomicrobium piriforme]
MRQQPMAILILSLLIFALGQNAMAGPRARAAGYPGYPPKKAIGAWTLPYNDQEKMFICMNRPVPPNWIIVGVRHNVNCNGLGTNAWIIERLPNYPGADIIICANQPVPPGWVVIETVHTAYCGHGVNGLRIRKQ